MTDTFINEYGEERDNLLWTASLIDEFNNEIESTKFHVYGLVGDWGVGKSVFIQIWEKNIRQGNCSVIHIDAFAKDYVQNPFSMIFDAFKTFIKESHVNDGDKKTVIEKAKKYAFASLKAAGQFGVNFLIDKIGKENANEFVSTIADSLFTEFDYEPGTEETDICGDLTKALSSMVESTGTELYIVIDELDRCRPDFALETLEKIKHLFLIEGVKFILVYNPTVITNIIKTKYGIDDANNRYIKKFIEKEISFPVNQMYSEWVENEASYLEQQGVNHEICRYIKEFSRKISRVMVMYNLSLRDTQRILISIDNKNGFEQIETNIFFGSTVAFLKAINKQEYERMVDYLQSGNSSFAANSPKRDTYNNLAIFLMGTGMVDSPEKLFVKYFKR